MITQRQPPVKFLPNIYAEGKKSRITPVFKGFEAFDGYGDFLYIFTRKTPFFMGNLNLLFMRNIQTKITFSSHNTVFLLCKVNFIYFILAQTAPFSFVSIA